MEKYQIGDTIEHNLMPGFRMKVQATGPCETDSARPEEHLQYEVKDPMGNVDWLCAYDVKRVASAPDGGFDVVAELQRQGSIVAAAEAAAEARGERVPLSGMPGFESWKRSALRAAGETYTIIRGERVPLDA